MIPLNAPLLLDTARRLKITIKKTGERVAWDPNEEQIAAWQKTCAHRRVFIAKPRQVGVSTAITLEDVLWTSFADRAGHRVRTAIVVDTEEKTRERVILAADFAHQLKCHVKSATTERVTFDNGSEIVGMTSGGNRAGSSTSFQRLHLSELPYWKDPDAYASLMPSLGMDNRAVIETTLDIEQPSGMFARQLWRNKNEWEKVFFPLQMHRNYRMDGETLSDEDWVFLQEEGFSERESAAFFMWAAANNCGGDIVKAFREYPQREEHMFQAAKSRFIRVTPPVRKPLRSLVVHGIAGDAFHVDIWREVADCSHFLNIGVDTATGKEQDRSAIAILDKRDCALVASFVSDTVVFDDLARIILDVQRAFTYEGVFGYGRSVPPALVEDNGVGEATVQACRRLNVTLTPRTTDEASRIQGLLEAKRIIESGVIDGPISLAEECDDLHRDDYGRFKGRKDLIMAIGFCLLDRRINPPAYVVDKAASLGRVNVKARMKREAMRNRGTGSGSGWH